MSKVVLSDKDFNKLPKVKGDDEKVIISDKEFNQLSEVSDSDQGGDSIMDDISFIGEGIDRITGAPMRSALMAARNLENPISAFAEQWAEPTDQAPTGKDVAVAYGVPDEPTTYTPEWGGETIEGGFSPADAAGIAVDIFADPSLLAGRIPFKAAQTAIKSSPRLQQKVLEWGGEKVLKTYLDDVPVGQIAKVMKKTGAERSVGDVLLEYNLGKHSGNPEKLLEEISGKLESSYGKIGKRLRQTGAKRSGGLVHKKAQEVDEIISKLSKGEGSRIADGESIFKDMVKSFEEAASKPGQPFDPKDLQSKAEVLRKYLGKYSSKAQREMFGGDVSPYMSFSDLNELKRGIGKRLREDIFKKDISDKVAKEDEVLTKLYLYLKNKIEDEAMNIDPKLADQLINANMDSHALQTIETALKSLPAKELKKAGKFETLADIITTATAGGVGYLGAEAAGISPGLGALALTGYTVGARNLGKKASRGMRNMKARAAQKLYSGAPLIEDGMASKAMIGADALRSESAISQEPMFQDQGRSPQSVGMPDPNINFMLADTEIPRNTQWIMDHPNLFVSRLMQRDPQTATQMKMALDKNQDTILRKSLPMIAQQFPEIFEYDEYGAFDGKILDPNMQRVYTESVMDDDSLDNFQKASIINHLNKTKEAIR